MVLYKMLRPSVREGERFTNSPEGRILAKFLQQQEEWLQKNGIKLIQLQAPIALQRTARLFNKVIDVDMTLEDVLKPRKYADTLTGIPYNMTFGYPDFVANLTETKQSTC